MAKTVQLLISVPTTPSLARTALRVSLLRVILSAIAMETTQVCVMKI